GSMKTASSWNSDIRSCSPAGPACIALKRSSTTVRSDALTGMEISRLRGYSALTMPGHVPSLDEQSLARLRRYVLALRHDPPGALPLDQLVGLARDVSLEAGITIDLRASKQLGAPLVVLRINEGAGRAAAIRGLSRREAQVCALIADGRSNKEIAARLFISLATVKDHVHKILRKTGAPNRAAVAVAYREARAAADRHDSK